MTAPALSEFEQLVQELITRTGVSREKAESVILGNRPDLDAPVARYLVVANNVREKEEQAYIAKLFRGFGCNVYNLSQARASKQTPGLPDLWVVHLEAKLAFWFETKRQVGGKLSVAQLQFRDECAITGARFYWGDRRSAAAVLVDHGIARVDPSGPCGIVPFHQRTPLQGHGQKTGPKLVVAPAGSIPPT